ncbi:NAD(P)/FAD-dependent oxidoreductase [Pedobacter sp. MC2016-15]|uniref:flavin-containing monooxygenase n=1 Tax=Pedobacter sp. MC2016-15 TaxID=2994473 RepID=UPI002246E030|nr:NAD(P)/FAD-dependent oxidoreductase [Pedobacter sp. MC2016-15]MCX2479454.1 NAD(P)/FAD-dependent oxidoreductase [Pedobacter sp. MC2016-15]
MILNTSEIYDVVIIGAGQAGLSAGYLLNQHHLSYVIFERGNIGESWLNQRWDSLQLDTPSWMNCLPGEIPDPVNSGRFTEAKDFYQGLVEYVRINDIIVKEHYQVTAVDKDDSTGLFDIETIHKGEMKIWLAKKVIVASGTLNEPVIPLMSKELPAQMMQLHSSQYRNPDQLPAGNVLIVGGAKSGAQIAEELAATVHKVYLATSKVGRIPRRYRGEEITKWLVGSGNFDMKGDDSDPALSGNGAPFLISGGGLLGHTLSLQGLYREGVTLLGRLLGAEEGKLLFASDTVDNIRFGDEVSAKLKQMVDGYLEKNGIEAVEGELDEADLPDPTGLSASPDTELDIAEHGITVVIWATGLRGSFGWLKLPVFDQQSKLVHEQGVSPIRGLFFLGFPWLRSRKSGVIYGMKEDAAFIVEQLLKQ